MATRKATPLDAGLIARKGEAAPAQIPTSTSTPAAAVPHGTKDTIALTVRLDPELYLRLKAYAVRFHPRRTSQALIVEALTRYLDDAGAEPPAG